jgi:hypothetical protein
MPETFRAYATGPDGKQRFKSISMKKYTPEEARVISEEWRQAVEKGEEFVMPKPDPKLRLAKLTSALPKMPEAPTVPDAGAGKSRPFTVGDLDSLEMPEGGGCSFALIGSTRSGKSTLMLYLWEKFFKKHITFLMTYSRHADIYKPLKKSAIVATGYHKELIDHPMKINRETDNHYKFCLVFDDLSLAGKSDTEMTKLLTIGRNSGMSAIISGQRLEMLNPTGRTNVNFVCCMRLNTDTAIRDVIETYLRSYFPPGMSIAEMVKVYKEATADHHFFLVNTLMDEVSICKIKV